MKIAVIGAGWYGCHIASNLKALGMNVTVFEKANKVLSAASGNNQFRLHQGFHYARNYRTRLQSRDGYFRFMERYAGFTREVKNNIYAVPNNDSLIDFLTYRLIMSSSGLEYNEVNPKEFNINNCNGCLLTNERVILTQKARDFFTSRLDNSLCLDSNITNIVQYVGEVKIEGDGFDYVIDATWGMLSGIDLSIFYEPTLLLYYRCIDSTTELALTLVDGQLCSIYPCEESGVITLSSVPHTPLGRCSSAKEAVSLLENFNGSDLNEKRRLMEQQIKLYYPSFLERHEFIEPQLSIKTKIYGATDDRSCYIEKNKRIIRVMSGKIDTIFYAMDSILNLLEKDLGGSI